MSAPKFSLSQMPAAPDDPFVVRYSAIRFTLAEHNLVCRRMRGVHLPRAYTHRQRKIVTFKVGAFIRLRWFLTKLMYQRKFSATEYTFRNDTTLIGTKISDIPAADLITIYSRANASIQRFSTNEMNQMIEAAILNESGGYEDAQNLRNPQTNEDFTAPQIRSIIAHLRSAPARKTPPLTQIWMHAEGSKRKIVMIEDAEVHMVLGPTSFSDARINSRLNNNEEISLWRLAIMVQKRARELRIRSRKLQYLINGTIRGFLRIPEADVRAVLIKTLYFMNLNNRDWYNRNYMTQVMLKERLRQPTPITEVEQRSYFPAVQNLLEDDRLRRRVFPERGILPADPYNLFVSSVIRPPPPMMNPFVNPPCETPEDITAAQERLAAFWNTLNTPPIPGDWPDVPPPPADSFE